MDEEFDQLVIECQNCHLQFYATELRVDPQTNDLKCVNCLTFPGGKVQIIRARPLQKKKSFMEEQRPLLASVMPRRKEDSYPLPPGYTLYKCENCRYLFKRKENFNGTCPYCSHRKLKMLRKN